MNLQGVENLPPLEWVRLGELAFLRMGRTDFRAFIFGESEKDKWEDNRVREQVKNWANKVNNEIIMGA